MKFLYKGYIYEAYSNENSSLLNYAKDWGNSQRNMEELRYLFRDWMQYEHPEVEDLDYMDDLDFSELKDRYGEYFPEFEKKLEGGLYRNEPEIYASSSRSMDLRRHQLLPNDTWLIHFSDNASYIAQEGFTIGATDVSRLGITKSSDYEPEENGYNFAFLADGKEAPFVGRKGKYGRDAVMFRNTGVHVYHYGDEENQVIFYGPDVKEFVLIKKVDGDFKVVGNDNYSAKDYLFDSSLTHKKEDSLTQCIKWVETNWQQYKNVLFWSVK